MKMRYYMAPMEGITNYIFRQAYRLHYREFDRYFTPFLAGEKLTSREKKEIDPANNAGMFLVPQILTNQVKVFEGIVNRLLEYGYSVVNLNLGCPSGTVVSKKRGAGQLQDLQALNSFLGEIYDFCEAKSVKLSIKTRIGMKGAAEWPGILKVYAKYPLEELIVHPRLREEYYGKMIHPDLISLTKDEAIRCPVCYNGDVVSKESLEKLLSECDTDIERVMIGRGIIRNPGILDELCDAGADAENTASGLNIRRDTGCDMGCDAGAGVGTAVSARRLRAFLNDLTEGYIEAYGQGQDRNILFKLKDIWNYLGSSNMFAGKDDPTCIERALKEIRKCDSLSRYRVLVDQILA